MGIFGAIVTTLFGILFTAVGWHVSGEVRAFRKGRRMTATVSRIEERPSVGPRKGPSSWCAHFILPEAVDGPLERRSLLSGSGYDFAPGTRLDVFVLPDREEVMIAESVNPVLLPVAFCLFGLVALGVGLFHLAGLA